jgi:hypothetical protein
LYCRFLGIYISVRISLKTRSGEKMRIPHWRIVGIIVIGLIAGALAKLIQRAVLLKGEPWLPSRWEVNVFRCGQLIPKPSRSSTNFIMVRALLASRTDVSSGRILYGSGRARHNAPYHWHLDPQDIAMAEYAIELCDARPSYVEENVDEFVGTVGCYCPWHARLVELRDYTSRAGRQTSTSEQ